MPTKTDCFFCVIYSFNCRTTLSDSHADTYIILWQYTWWVTVTRDVKFTAHDNSRVSINQGGLQWCQLKVVGSGGNLGGLQCTNLIPWEAKPPSWHSRLAVSWCSAEFELASYRYCLRVRHHSRASDIYLDFKCACLRISNAELSWDSTVTAKRTYIIHHFDLVFLSQSLHWGNSTLPLCLILPKAL